MVILDMYRQLMNTSLKLRVLTCVILLIFVSSCNNSLNLNKSNWYLIKTTTSTVYVDEGSQIEYQFLQINGDSKRLFKKVRRDCIEGPTLVNVQIYEDSLPVEFLSFPDEYEFGELESYFTNVDFVSQIDIPYSELYATIDSLHAVTSPIFVVMEEPIDFRDSLIQKVIPISPLGWCREKNEHAADLIFNYDGFFKFDLTIQTLGWESANKEFKRLAGIIEELTARKLKIEIGPTYRSVLNPETALYETECVFVIHTDKGFEAESIAAHIRSEYSVLELGIFKFSEYMFRVEYTEPIGTVH